MSGKWFEPEYKGQSPEYSEARGRGEEQIQAISMEIERGRRSPPDDSFHESDAIFPAKIIQGRNHKEIHI